VPETLDKVVGRYELVRVIGRGGMAVVYLARQTDLDRLVALKELAGFPGEDPAAAQRFLRESRLAGSLSHPNIVTVHEYFVHEGTPYIAMECVPRGSLRPLVGLLPLGQIFGVLEGVLAGLAHAEQHGIVHRDLKPENLMVTKDGRVKIADFGIAKATNTARGATFLTVKGTTVGTPAYMAPEQAMAANIGPWTDLYSLGCIAFELLTHQLPFSGTDDPMALLLRHVRELPPTARSVRPDLDPALSDWVGRLLVKEPEDRTQSAEAAWDELEDIAIRTLGPRWRREGRIREHSADTPSTPLTPAPFEATQGPPAPDAESDDYISYVPGGVAPPGPATPPPLHPPGPELHLTVGPPTPPPLDAADAPAPVAPPPGRVPAGPAGSASAPAAAPSPATDSGFVTYGRRPGPTAESDEEAATTPPPPEAVAPAPSRERIAPPPPAGPVAEPASDPRSGAAQAPAPVASGGALTLPPTSAPPDRPEPPAAHMRSRRLRTTRLVAIAAVAVAAVAGALTGASGGASAGADGEQALRVRADVPGGRLRVPASWRPVGQGSAPAELGRAPSVRLAPGGSAANGSVLVARVPTADASLLPARLARAVGATPGRPGDDRVRLGPDGPQAYRHRALWPRDVSGPVTVFAVPTTSGTVTVSCVPGAASAAGFADLCLRIASTLQPSGSALALGPDRRYASGLERELSRLRRVARTAAAQLEAARTRTRQGDAAAGVGAAFAAAATRIAALDPAPADRAADRALVRALRRAAGVYRRAATAARKGRATAYAAAREDAGGAARALRAAVQQLRAAGYGARR